MSSYKTIDGIRYEKTLLDLATEYTKSEKDGRISLADIKKLVKSAEDGAGITDTERRTLGYIVKHYNPTRKAKNWFLEEFVRDHQASQLGITDKKARVSFTALYSKTLTDQPIQTKADLVKFINQAIALELTTIPLYLTSSYSVVPATKDDTLAYAYVFSVAVEEMLHLGLNCNILTSLGEPVKLYVDPADPCSPIPVFPTPMPHRIPTLELTTGSLTYDRTENVFMEVELPENMNITAGNKAMASAVVNPCDIEYQYHTIGAFYETIKNGMEFLEKQAQGQGTSIFAKNADIQVPQGSIGAAPYITYFIAATNSADSGVFNTVSKLDEANQAVQTIVDQGEGSHGQYDDDTDTELAHYYKFKEIVDNKLLDNYPVYNFPDNPKQDSYPANIKTLSVLFNACYCYVLVLMEEIWGQNATTQSPRLNQLYNQMNQTMNPVGKALAAQALPDGKHNAAPTFEFYQFKATTLDDRRAELVTLADAARSAYLGDADIARTLGQVIEVLSRTESVYTGAITPATGEYTWTRDIKPMVSKRDKGNMEAYGIPVATYDDWKSNQGFLGALQRGMPKTGPYFTKEELGIIQKWVNDNYPE